MDQLNNIKELIKGLGRTFVGATEQWYPTYMVHLDFLKPNDDPMYQIDWSIMHFIQDMPKVDKTSVAKIIGMEPGLIEYRIRNLCDTGDLLYNQNYGQYQITEKGKEDYFGPDGSVMYVYSSKDLLIDGNSLSIMDDKIYTVRSRIRSGYRPDIVENVTITKDGKPIRTLLKKLEGMTNANKEKLHIPADSKDFTTNDEPDTGCIKIFFVFSIDSKGNACKDIIYNDEIIKIPFYSDDIHKFFYGRNVNFNYGFTNYEEKDVKNRIFDFTNETICNILKGLFNWKNVDETYYVYKTDNYKNCRPLSVNVNLKRFMSCPNKNMIKKALRSGEEDYQNKDTVISLSVFTEDDALKQLLYFEEKVEHIYRTKGDDSLVQWLKATDIVENRKKLMALDRFDFLEMLDNKLFIQIN
jgi:hypothetical protein